MSEEQLDTQHEPVWCVVANIKREHPFGPGGTETRVGTRKFRGGTKVYIAGCYPGTCDAVLAVGLHRNSRQFISCVVDVMYVENFRAKLAYHPAVIQLIKSDDRCWIKTKEEAEQYAAAFPGWQEMRKKTAE
ncbi:MAG: hypothetical protein U0791_26785 [Gemmataceae bacterium]